MCSAASFSRLLFRLYDGLESVKGLPIMGGAAIARGCACDAPRLEITRSNRFSNQSTVRNPGQKRSPVLR